MPKPFRTFVTSHPFKDILVVKDREPETERILKKVEGHISCHCFLGSLPENIDKPAYASFDPDPVPIKYLEDSTSE